MAAEFDDSSASRAVLIFFAVFALYVLSIGPVARYVLEWYCDLWKGE